MVSSIENLMTRKLGATNGRKGYGLAAEAYRGAPRGISSPWPESPTLSTRPPDWAYSLASQRTLRAERDALAVISLIWEKVGR